MTKQELNRDIKRMYKSYFDKIYTLESNDFFKWIEESLKPEYKRLYFADNEATLLANGNTTKPKAIPQSPFWVITNNNTSRKRQMVEQLMSRMNFQAELIEKVTGSI